jgi:1-deoxy-D-xylulose-5-phosphate synthase
VVLAVDRAGLVGADGATHQGAFDVAFLRAIPHLTVMAPVVGEDLAPLLETALALPGPSAIRFPRLTVPEVPPDFPTASGSMSGARWLKRAEETELAILALGNPALAALQAARDRPRWSVLDVRYASPIDRGAVLEAARAGRIVTVEEGVVRGGVGSAVLELLAEAGVTPRVRTLGLPHAFIRHGDARAQRVKLGLDADGIRAAAEALLG